MKFNRKCARFQSGILVAALAVPIWAAPALAQDARQAGSEGGIVTEGGPDWLDRWWVEPDLEWDNDDDGVDMSIDAEIGHMVTDRVGLWGRPAYRADHDEQAENWDLRFGIRYRFN